MAKRLYVLLMPAHKKTCIHHILESRQFCKQNKNSFHTSLELWVKEWREIQMTDEGYF